MNARAAATASRYAQDFGSDASPQALLRHPAIAPWAESKSRPESNRGGADVRLLELAEAVLDEIGPRQRVAPGHHRAVREEIRDVVGAGGAEGETLDRCRSVQVGARWIGSTHGTFSGFSAGSMFKLTTTASLSLRTSTHSSVSSDRALIS